MSNLILFLLADFFHYYPIISIIVNRYWYRVAW